MRTTKEERKRMLHRLNVWGNTSKPKWIVAGIKDMADDIDKLEANLKIAKEDFKYLYMLGALGKEICDEVTKILKKMDETNENM